ncbi:hypothetical protein G7046_g1948 [Stylonectria norvegica]|nr:hypothetical protein G7046_g1948 [Stylonectria norvegica]
MSDSQLDGALSSSQGRWQPPTCAVGGSWRQGYGVVELEVEEGGVQYPPLKALSVNWAGLKGAAGANLQQPPQGELDVLGAEGGRTSNNMGEGLDEMKMNLRATVLFATQSLAGDAPCRRQLILSNPCIRPSGVGVMDGVHGSVDVGANKGDSIQSGRQMDENGSIAIATAAMNPSQRIAVSLTIFNKTSLPWADDDARWAREEALAGALLPHGPKGVSVSPGFGPSVASKVVNPAKKKHQDVPLSQYLRSHLIVGLGAAVTTEVTVVVVINVVFGASAYGTAAAAAAAEAINAMNVLRTSIVDDCLTVEIDEVNCV